MAMSGWARVLWRLVLAALLGLAALAARPAPAAARAVAAVVPLGLVPHGAAIHPVTGRLYVTGNGAGGRVLVVDGRATLGVEAIEVGGCPAGAAVDAAAGLVFVADACGARVWVIDAATDRVLTEVPIAGPAWEVAVDPDAGRAYALRWDGVGQVFALAGPPWAGVAALAVAPDPWALAVDAAGRVHITHADGGLTVVDGRRAVVHASHTTGLTGAPAPATLDAAGRLIVGGRDSATGAPRVAVLAGGGRPAGSVAPPGGHVVALAADARPGRVWGCSGGDAPVAWMAEPATGTVGDAVALASACGAVAVDPLTGRRYVVGQVGRSATGLLTVIDGASLDCPLDVRPGRPPRCLA
jgi:DNA-binding beta-propeller fold protein YncE